MQGLGIGRKGSRVGGVVGGIIFAVEHSCLKRNIINIIPVLSSGCVTGINPTISQGNGSIHSSPHSTLALAGKDKAEILKYVKFLKCRL